MGCVLETCSLPKNVNSSEGQKYKDLQNETGENDRETIKDGMDEGRSNEGRKDLHDDRLGEADVNSMKSRHNNDEQIHHGIVYESSKDEKQTLHHGIVEDDEIAKNRRKEQPSNHGFADTKHVKDDSMKNHFDESLRSSNNFSGVQKSIERTWDDIHENLKQYVERNEELKKRSGSRKGWKVIHFFISSTFADFFAEREVLIKKVIIVFHSSSTICSRFT